MSVPTPNKEYSLPGIQEYFSEKTIFLTGSTGQVGQLILEKLLRSCLGIKKIYLLIREKKEKSAEERLEKLFDNVLYTLLKSVNPGYKTKVIPINGDNSEENIGMSPNDMKKLIDEVDCVIHCSARVRFDDDLRSTVYTNVRGTRDMMRLGKKMKNLQSFVYVSTAYSNCLKKEIDEVLYEPPLMAKELLALVDTFDDATLVKLIPSLLGSWPNTYAYSKCIAESVVEQEGTGLPIAIVRPSIVVTTYKEPIEGWANTIYGPLGICVAHCLGALHVLNCEKDYIVNMVPGDYVANNIIAAAWRVGSQKSLDGVENEGIRVYNCVSSPQNPLTWARSKALQHTLTKKVPSKLAVWYPFLILVSSPTLYGICDFFLHLIPAHIADFVASCMGKKPMFVKIYQKLSSLSKVLVYFTTNQWTFFNDNTVDLWSSLSKEDKDIFPFNMPLLDWEELYYNSVKGGRVYVLKDPLETVPQGKRKLWILTILHYGIAGLLLFGFSMLTCLFCRLFLGMVY